MRQGDNEPGGIIAELCADWLQQASLLVVRNDPRFAEVVSQVENSAPSDGSPLDERRKVVVLRNFILRLGSEYEKEIARAEPKRGRRSWTRQIVASASPKQGDESTSWLDPREWSYPEVSRDQDQFSVLRSVVLTVRTQNAAFEEAGADIEDCP